MENLPARSLLDNVEEVLLMGPGPSCVPESVYEALRSKTLGHMDPYFLRIMDEIKELLRRIMNTRNAVTFPVSGTGSAGMEASFVNLIEPGDPVLILKNGVFGNRMEDVARRLGASVDALEFPWGTPVVPQAAAEKIRKSRPKIVAVVHAETSTGVKNPVGEIGVALKGTDALYLVDTVTSLGGIEVSMDVWGIDALYSGSQKCLSCPPGLAPLSFSPKALDALKKRKTKVPNWYLDLNMILSYWEGATRVYHHTAPVNMLYALYQSLRLIFEEGPERVFHRHEDSHVRLVRGLERLGIKMLVDEPHRLPMLNAALCPAGVDEASVRRRLREDFRIEIGGGLGPLAGRVWRIGLMGHTARAENVDRLLGALEAVL